MKKTLLFLIFLFIIVIGIGMGASRAAEVSDSTKALKVLIIGNSQCFVILRAQLLTDMAISDQGQRSIKIGNGVKGGASLKSHWEAGAGAGTARAMIAAGGWDSVVLQDAFFVKEAMFQPYVRKFYQLIKESGGKTVLFGTASVLSDYPKGFERLHRLHLYMGKELGVPVVDASYAYLRYYGDKASTEKLESLFAKDKRHPGLRGSYIYSCLLYSAMTGRSPVGLAAPDEIPANVVKVLQQTAWAQHQETVAALKK